MAGSGESFVDVLIRRPERAPDVAADVVRILAPIGVIIAIVVFGPVEAAVMMLVFGGVFLARGARLPWLLDVTNSVVLLAAAWFSIADLYAQIWWIDIVTHFAAGGVLAAVARVLLERWQDSGVVPANGSRASVVAGGLMGCALALALSTVWEFLEWWGHTYIDDSVNIGYQDTVGDLAAGGLGGIIAGVLLAASSRRVRLRQDG